MTDFEQFGYNLGHLPVRDRYWMITVDFESFDRTNVSMWVPAMRHWADQAKRYGFKFSFFTAMENVMGLKYEAPEAYSDFLESIALLHQSGVEFHPHAHSVFDPDSGACLLDSDSPLPAGYTKRRCMFYRAHYDHQINFGVWMDSVRACYETFLAEAGVPVPDNLAFRAGGWDYGSSPEDLHTYLEALNYAGYRIDSSACSGAFGTPSWRMGAEYQANVFRLGPDLIEVAPNEARNCGMPQHGLPSAFQSRSPGPGVFMNVLHFDHLFHRVRSGECQYFAVTDHDEIRGRIDEFFQSMEAWRGSPSLKIATFDDIEFGWSSRRPTSWSRSGPASTRPKASSTEWAGSRRSPAVTGHDAIFCFDRGRFSLLDRHPSPDSQHRRSGNPERNSARWFLLSSGCR